MMHHQPAFRLPRVRHAAAGMALMLAATATAAGASDGADMQSFRACAAIEDNAGRLACYDKAAAAFDFDGTKARLEEAGALKAEAARLKAEAKAREAEAARLKAEVKAKDEAEARRVADLEARRTTEFGKDAPEVKTVDRIDSEIADVRKPRAGSRQGLIIGLKNGQYWIQADGTKAGSVREGMKVHIIEGPLGGFIFTIDTTGRSFRAKRIG